MQNYTAASVTAPDVVGNQAVLLRVLCWMVMNASWKAMIRGNDGEKIRKQGSDPSHFNSPGKLWS